MAEDFITKFNRLLGDRAGIPAQQPIMPRNVNLAGAAEMRGRTKTKTKTTSSAKAKVPKPEFTTEQKKVFDLIRQAQERELIEKAIDDEKSGKSILNQIGSGVGRAFDVILRPSYAVNEALRSTSESINAGEPIWSVGDDIVSGAASGLAGTRKTTGGDVVEENAKRAPGSWASGFPLLAMGEGTNSILESEGVGDTTKKVIRGGKILGGAAVDIGLDPLNVVGGSATTILRKTGKTATEAGAREIAEVAARNAAKKHLPAGSTVNVPGGLDAFGKQLASRFTSGADEVGRSASDSMGKAVLEITGGGQAGKVKFGNKTLVPTVANAAAESYRGVRLTPFERNLAKFTAHAEGTARLTTKQIQTLLKNPEFKLFHDDLMRTVNLSRTKNPINTWEQLVKHLNGRDPEGLTALIKKVADKTRASIGDEVKGFMDEFGAEISKISYNAPGLRVAGMNVPFKRVGQVYAKMAEKAGSRFSGDMAKKLSYEKLFPGRLSLISQKTKSMGVRAYDKVQRATETMAKGITHQERKMISEALDSGVPLTDSRLEAARQWIRQQYDEIRAEEVAMGVRSNGDSIDNYQFVFNRRGSKTARDTFKKNRKITAKGTGTVKGFTAADAAKQGLHPVDDPFEALLYRKMDSNRSMTRAWFKKDLLEHYGLLAKKLSREEKISRGLVAKAKKDLPVDLQNQMGLADEWYLPNEIENVYKSFQELTTLGNKDGAVLTRLFDNLTNKFKFLATVPFPGFHIRNMMGDVYMGFLDGVRSRTYSELFNKIQKTRAGHLTKFKIGSGLDWSYDELNDFYMRHAASGRFYTADIDPRMLRSAPKKAVDKLRDISEKREDFGRIAHFLHAMREEYPAALKAGKKDALDKAIESSVYRVNKYKFDYSALTAAEHQIKRVGIPFYTYSRKAMPTLIEALFLSPRNIGRIGKLFSGNHGENFENFNHMLLPDYMRQAGYAILNDEKEPWALGGDIFPMPSAFTKMDFSGRQEFFQSIVAQMNPMLGAVPELMADRYAFNDRPIDSTIDYIGSKIGPVGGLRQTTNDNMSIAERVIANRIGLGLPLRKITEGQQEFAYQDLRDEVVDDAFRDWNDKNADTGIRVFMSNRQDGSDFQVKDTETDLVVFTSRDVKEAMKFAEMAAKGMRASGRVVEEEPKFNRELLKLLPQQD